MKDKDLTQETGVDPARMLRDCHACPYYKHKLSFLENTNCKLSILHNDKQVGNTTLN